MEVRKRTRISVLDKSLEISNSTQSLFTEENPVQSQGSETQRMGLLACLNSVFPTKPFRTKMCSKAGPPLRNFINGLSISPLLHFFCFFSECGLQLVFLLVTLRKVVDCLFIYGIDWNRFFAQNFFPGFI